MGYDASVVICTYNRAALLTQTLDALGVAAAASMGRTCEVIVVDNNSTDETDAIVRARIPSFPVPLRLVIEPRQGKGYALNTGIAAASAPILVFTDDDVWIPPGWLAAAIEPLMERTDIDYTGGPARPMWEVEPPAWIHGDPGLLWGPIALLDYGPEPFIFEERKRIAMGVNMAVRRSLIDRVGGFHPALERRGGSLMGQGQAEFFCRTRADGARGLYVPGMWVQHYVPASRLTREYYRRWWYWKGVARAQMQDLHPVTELGLDLRRVPQFAGIPRFMWGSGLRDVGAWLSAVVRGDHVRIAECEMALTYYAGYARTRLTRGRGRHPESRPEPSPRDPSAAPIP